MIVLRLLSLFFFFNDTATTEIYTLSLHDALPIFLAVDGGVLDVAVQLLEVLRVEDRDEQRCPLGAVLLVQELQHERSEEHTSELQSPCNLVCRLLLEKKKKHQRLLSTTL